MRPLAGAVFGALLVAGCVRPSAGPPRAASAPPVTAPAVTDSRPRAASALASHPGFAAADLAPALAAFRRSCPALLKRTDASGLTLPGDWAEACAAAVTTADPHAFFATALRPVTLGDGRGLNTGYFEPELAGSRSRGAGYTIPLYRRPPELVDLDLGAFTLDLTGKHIRGRVTGGSFVPFFDRAAIEDGALAGRGLELAWATDPYDAFFLEIQGSGRLRLPDGGVMRVGYDGQNGRGYTAIGKLLRDRGELAPGQATMDGIIGWMRSHPDAGRSLMRENRSYVFFRELTTDPALGPNGALGLPLTPETSVAADPRFVPLGVPIWLDTTVAGAAFRRLVVVQDTGGAIKGANRLDVFWGAGDHARFIAGGLSATGTATLLLPLAAAARILGQALHGPPPAP